ncbi:unnamed protein product [Cuscuta europaea]|uniref:Reverse transcriptase n=1 Tax=Cuscuta europaea TaxID=41803 RepID=A0A9P0ZQX1_CUSEU|nr:unnamed protein product [Cuscuta europaea]
MDPVLFSVDHLVSNDQNQYLLRPIREEDVRKAIFSMHPDKSLGPDGLSPVFFQHFWEVVGPEVVDFYKQTFLTSASGRGTSWKHWVGMSFPKKKGGMGFKRMREFNLAMLEKQAGRIFKQPDSLVARVLKARYYPCSSFIEAKIGHNPSFVWRSIFETHSLIKQGFMWKMGKGNLINVWRDPWSPCPDNSKVESVVIEGLENCTVAGLLQAGGAARDIDILTDLFNSRDRKLILKIPVSLRRVQGQVIRRWEEDGRYSVRSSYRFLTQNVEDDPLAEKELLHGLQKYDEMELCSSSGSWTGLRASLLISERRIAAESSYANGGYRCWSIKLYGEGGVTHKNQ